MQPPSHGQTLPAEVWSQITDYRTVRPETLALTEVSANTGARSEYLKACDEKPISEAESNSYLATGPLRFAASLFVIDEKTDAYVPNQQNSSFSIRIYEQKYNYHPSRMDYQKVFSQDVSYLQLNPTVYTNFTANFDALQSTKLYSVGRDSGKFYAEPVLFDNETNSYKVRQNYVGVSLDFLSMYRIFQRRGGCMARDPDYAKKKIIKEIMNFAPPDPMTVFYLGNVSKALWANVIIHDLYPLPPLLAIQDSFYNEKGELVRDMGVYPTDWFNEIINRLVEYYQKL